MVVGGGFEPPKASPTDLQSVPFDHSGTPPRFQQPTEQHPETLEIWSQRQELNPRPADYKSAALPTELLWPEKNDFKILTTVVRISQNRYIYIPFFSIASLFWDNCKFTAHPDALNVPAAHGRVLNIKASSKSSPSYPHKAPAVCKTIRIPPN
jgi:hypothetical protein